MVPIRTSMTLHNVLILVMLAVKLLRVLHTVEALIALVYSVNNTSVLQVKETYSLIL